MSTADPDLIRARAEAVLGELHATVRAVDPTAAAALLAAAAGADRLFFAAQGRSGLIARAIAMRWMHLGVAAHVAGETVTPAIGPGDLLVCLSAGGRTAATISHAGTARAAGARVAALTTAPASPLAGAAHLVVPVPAGTPMPSIQHAGSLFEQACLLLGDVLCGVHQATRALPDHDLDRRHANLL